MQQQFGLRSRTGLRKAGVTLLILVLLLAGSAARAQAQDVSDPTIDPAAEVLVPPGPVEPVLPVEPAPWEGEIETLEYVEPALPVDAAGEDAVWAGKTTRLNANADTFIASNDPSDNFGFRSTLLLGWPIRDNKNYGASRILIRFDIGPLPNRAKIYSARMHLYLDSSTPDSGSTMQINGALATRGWNEQGATWNNARDIHGSQWRLGDVGTQPGWKNFNLTSQVQSWVNGQSNNGMVIIGYEVAPNARIFRSRESGGTAPYLEVNYECDTLPPVSKLNSLPAQSPGVFNVSWSGYDQAPKNCAPTGIRKFHVQYRINGRGWVDWKSTTSTSATFDNYAANGDTVDFRVYADDNAGNEERRPSNPQATTRIVSQAPTVGMTPLPAITNAASFVINWAPINAPIGVASYDVQWQVNNGPWMDLLLGTAQTSYMVSGAQSEYTYGFRVRARDRLGNVGEYPPAPQAQTTVVLYPIATMVPFNPNIINSTSPVTTSFTLRWTGNTPPGTTITQYQIHYRMVDLNGTVLQPWTVWQTFNGTVNQATFPIALGNGLYQFEATATNDKGQTTPFAGRVEATMIVDLNDTIKPMLFMPVASNR